MSYRVIIPGRYQPITKTHLHIYKTLNSKIETWIVIVRGILPNGKLYIDRSNPFTIEEQREMFEILNLRYRIVYVYPPYTLYFLQMRKQLSDLEPYYLFLRTDNKIKGILYTLIAPTVILPRKGGISATEVRECYLNPNCEYWEKYVPIDIVPFLRRIRKDVIGRVRNASKTVKLGDITLPKNLEYLLYLIVPSKKYLHRYRIVQVPCFPIPQTPPLLKRR